MIRSQTCIYLNVVNIVRVKILVALQGSGLCTYDLQAAFSLRGGFSSNFCLTVQSLLLKTDSKSRVLFLSLFIQHPYSEFVNILGTRLPEYVFCFPQSNSRLIFTLSLYWFFRLWGEPELGEAGS
jgi:hypothetical protein